MPFPVWNFDYKGNNNQKKFLKVFVNNILIRLAEAFQGDKSSAKLEQFLNVIRLRIIRILKEKQFQNKLHLAFSSEDIAKRVMKVSHSNEWVHLLKSIPFHFIFCSHKARSLTLLFFAAMAPIVCENKKVRIFLMGKRRCFRILLLEFHFQDLEFTKWVKKNVKHL